VDIDTLKWRADGLLPVVIVDANTGAVLTLAWANREALVKTLETRETHLFSRSRNAQWRKGESSGNTQRVLEVVADCDSDAILYRVVPNGPACHTGAASCFHNELLAADGATPSGGAFAAAMTYLEAVLQQRKGADPSESYVAKLYAGGVDRIGKKIGEEATEVVIAAKNESEDELVWEASDLLFHLLVLLAAKNIPLAKVGEHLLGRATPRDED
jgi:phosphoribosyl-ATP pyrophosphohydrolase/phosphoribosyl-AMP cyclohydrolase